jgi:alpha-L-arabinofuranosidase
MTIKTTGITMLLLISAIMLISPALAADSGTASVTIDASSYAADINPDLIGVFFEDINYGADGGLYAELVQNRSFEYYSVNGNNMNHLYAWSEVEKGGGNITISVEDSSPLNINNTHYLKMVIINDGSEVGIKNSGFDSIPVKAGEYYDFSFYVRRTRDFTEPFHISLENTVGNVVYGSAQINSTSSIWTKYEAEIYCNATNLNARLVVTTTGSGTVYMDMISLFPRHTFKGRKNGLRADIAQTIANLKPGFVRFPGGCITHGDGLINAYRWKDTVGDVAERKPNWNLWGYHQSYGLGFYEYFLFCEDIGAKPLPVIPVGVSCGFRTFEAVPMNQINEWVQDALDLIEFANGNETTTWGAVRAQMGHPEPFNLEYICLGNEEHDTREFRDRLPLFVDAIRQNYPEIKIIGTSGLGSGIPLYHFMAQQGVDSSDEHYYNSPEWFISNSDRFDDFDRDMPKIFIGEYASQSDTLYNAVAEACFLTGIERNSDIVQFAAYAPLLKNTSHYQWDPDLIWFTHDKVFGTASYYVQQMFSLNHGDVYLGNTVTFSPGDGGGISGAVGVGTWATRAEFDDVTVMTGSTKLFEEHFSTTSGNWNVNDGNFSVAGGVYRQTGNHTPAWSVEKNSFNEDTITYSLRARKTGGAEGFLIIFGYRDRNNYYWWNIGGWGNTIHAIEKCVNGSRGPVDEVAGRINSNQWYDIKIEIVGNTIRCFLDDRLIHQYTDSLGIAVSPSKELETGDLIIKMANPNDYPVLTNINLQGLSWVDPHASIEVLSGGAGDRNSVADPYNVIPTTGSLTAGLNFDYNAPATSVQVIRLKTRSDD